MSFAANDSRWPRREKPTINCTNSYKQPRLAPAADSICDNKWNEFGMWRSRVDKENFNHSHYVRCTDAHPIGARKTLTFAVAFIGIDTEPFTVCIPAATGVWMWRKNQPDARHILPVDKSRAQHFISMERRCSHAVHLNHLRSTPWSRSNSKYCNKHELPLFCIIQPIHIPIEANCCGANSAANEHRGAARQRAVARAGKSSKRARRAYKGGVIKNTVSV